MQSLNISRLVKAPWKLNTGAPRIPRQPNCLKFPCGLGFRSPRKILWYDDAEIRKIGCGRRGGASVQIENVVTREVGSSTEIGDYKEGMSPFSGLGTSSVPVGICETRTLDPVLSLDDALREIQAAVTDYNKHKPASSSGIIRVQVPLPPDIKALQWLQGQSGISSLPKIYFSARAPRGDGEEYAKDSSDGTQSEGIDACGFRAVSGVGGTVLFHDSKPFSKSHWTSIQRCINLLLNWRRLSGCFYRPEDPCGAISFTYIVVGLCPRRFLSKGSPEIKVYGAMRFNPHEEPAEEWRHFGSFYFLIPQVEFCENEGCSMLAASIAWDTALNQSLSGAVKSVSDTLSQISSQVGISGRRRMLQVEEKQHTPSESLWHRAVNITLQKISEAESSTYHDWQLDPSSFDDLKLSKVVMARRTKLRLSDDVDALTLLASLQEKDPSAYQFCIEHPVGASFIGSTPERLFARKGLRVASEAVAATRARGHTGSRDLDIGIDLLLSIITGVAVPGFVLTICTSSKNTSSTKIISPRSFGTCGSSKDQNEFEIVRESIKRNLERVCKIVQVESHKSIIKQARVQHLYGRFVGELHNEAGEFDLLEVLHPTPAVCGHPQAPAREAITASESFDRGLYAGPVGWFGGTGAEFAVGIRSSLIHPSSKDENGGANGVFKSASVNLYAGVGVVKSSDPQSEWRELELKVSQFEALLQPECPLEQVANINALWAKLIVEECCRLGVTYFCIAPGSRSSPLAAAAAANPRATCVSCIDERSLAFHGVGYGRGARKPAAVITSSGTAVSNLLPAVVEASQDCVPLLVLTADRPHELRDTSANQTIDQVKHFGGYVRYHFDLPPADDKIPARMVLTTLDTAIFQSKTSPSGPVHINCAFREPLAGLVEPWDPACLKGLNRWVSNPSPFTTHFEGNSSSGNLNNVAEIVAELKEAKRGLIVVGGLHSGEETWAVAMLASHMGWPVVPDVLSGLRIGDTFAPGRNEEQLVIHYFDQILLSKAVGDSIQPDVILQIGGRLTSKRVGKFLESSNPRTHILLEDHPFRADPSHVLTHRVQASSINFVASLMRILPKAPHDHTFLQLLQALSKMVGMEIESKLNMGLLVTEPFVARAVATSILPGSTLFLGNSMPIRDVEMYSIGRADRNLSEKFLGLTTRVASNRGASGIDGVLSTAIGFAAGSTRRVTLLVGDVSFLHDTNGLALLKERVGQPPVTVVVVNNEGGGIFSFLPIAKTVPTAAFNTLWSTEHDINISKLCRAHRVSHTPVRTKQELESALEWARRSPFNCVVEVESNIEHNTQFHHFLQNTVTQATNRAFEVLSRFNGLFGQGGNTQMKISTAESFQYKIPLSAPLTTSVRRSSATNPWREGFLIRIMLHSGISGMGEVAPLEGLHKESLVDVKEQLQVLLPILKGLILPPTLVLLNGSFSSWLFSTLGIQAKTLHPSVRCGLEMAVLEALASSVGCTLSELLIGHGQNRSSDEQDTFGTQICALLESEGTPTQVADEAANLVKQGFCTLKFKVGRRATPQEDAQVLKKIRERVGGDVNIRADANRKWNYQQAIEFANLAQTCDLQYLEEPLMIPQDIPRFCKETGIPVALDESVDEDFSLSSERIETLLSDGVVAVVIKPGRVGGLEQAAAIAEWAHSRGRVAVISAAFETSVGLYSYAHLAAYVDHRRLQTITTIPPQSPQAATTAHGLGTYMWLGGDVIQNKQFDVTSLDDRGIVAPLGRVIDTVHRHHLNDKFVVPDRTGWDLESYSVNVTSGNTVFKFHVWDTEGVTNMDDSSPTLLFLHGLLGTGHEWLPVIRPLSSSFRCIAVDLPGHGTTSQSSMAANKVSMELLCNALVMLLEKLGIKHFIPVGYSMGARIALYLALRHSEQVLGVVSISGSPGLEDEKLREARAAQDTALAQTLREGGLKSFIHSWYQQPLWESLRHHPNFEEIRRKRMTHKDEYALADILASLSVGQQPSLWEELGGCSRPALLVTGSLDSKFVKIAHQMCKRAGQQAPPRARRSKRTSQAQKKEMWESEDFRLPYDFMKEFPEVNMLVPDIESLPKDKGFATFFAQEMKKLQLEDNLALDMDDWPSNDDNELQQWEISNPKSGQVMFQLVEVEDCGHAVHIENPWILVQLLRVFLQKLEYP